MPTITHIDPENRTILTGWRAEVTGSPNSPWHKAGTYGWWQGWTGPDDVMTWTVSVRQPGNYELALVAEGGQGRETVEVNVGNRMLRASLQPYWDRVDLGTVRLPAGRSRIALRPAGNKPFQKLGGLELIRPAVRRAIGRRAEALRADTSWMVQRVYGLMFHWTNLIYPRRGPRKGYQQAVRDFDLAGFVRQVAATGAGWVYLTTCHAGHYWPGPNAAIDRVLPGRTCKRDLIGEMAEALEARGVRLGLYYHLGHEDRSWWGRVGYDTAGWATFFRTFQSVIKDAGQRYGEHVFGWWFDDGFHSFYPIHPTTPWEKLLTSARKGYRNRVVCWNAWNAPKVTEFADTSTWDSALTDKLIAGGGSLPVGGSGRFGSGPQEGLQAHITTLLQPSWGHGRPNTPRVGRCLYTTEQLIAWLTEARARRAIVTLNAEIFQDGTFSDNDVRRFRAIYRALWPQRSRHRVVE